MSVRFGTDPGVCVGTATTPSSSTPTLLRPSRCAARPTACSASTSSRARRHAGRTTQRPYRRYEEALKDLATGQRIDFDEGSAELIKFLEQRVRSLFRDMHQQTSAGGSSPLQVAKRRERNRKKEEAEKRRREEQAKAKASNPDPMYDDMPDMEDIPSA